MEYKILVVDDESDLREILQCNLENAGYQVETAESAEEPCRNSLPIVRSFCLTSCWAACRGSNWPKSSGRA